MTNLLLTIARIGAALAFFAVTSGVMVWVLVGAAQAWVSLYDAIEAAGGYLREPAALMGWLAWVLRLDYFISVVVFVHGFLLLDRLWWTLKGMA